MIKTIDECFFQIQNGANIKQGDVDGGFPITRIETTANDKFNRDRMGYAGITDISKYESYVLEDGDLLMSHINSVQYLGRTVLYIKEADETIIHGMNLLRLKSRRDVINPAYARYCFYGHSFRSKVGNITKKSVNQASFAVKDLKQIKIEVPSLSEQDQIVKVLDKLQNLIKMRKDELSALDDLIKADVYKRQERDSAEPDLLGKILDRDNLNRAYKRVKANKGAPGVDGMTIEAALPLSLIHISGWIFPRTPSRCAASPSAHGGGSTKMCSIRTTGSCFCRATRRGISGFGRRSPAICTPPGA